MATTNSRTYEHTLTTARNHVDYLLELADQEINKIAESAPGKLKERMLSVVSRKGKRIRSTLLFLFAQSNNTPINTVEAAKSAASIELLHLASLIHDDVIDVSETRRGDKTAHTKWGNHMAVLVGDYTLAKSLSLVVSNDLKIAGIISDTAGALVAGEIQEIDNQGNSNISIDEYNDIIYGKTASLIEASTEIGAIHAGLSDEQVLKAKQTGRLFGMAFQIVDDLLDFGFGATELGKKPFTDLDNGIMSLPVILYLSNCTDTERQEFKELTSQEMTSQSSNIIFSKFAEKNIFGLCQKIAIDYLNEASHYINELPESKSRDILIDICQAMTFRSN